MIPPSARLRRALIAGRARPRLSGGTSPLARRGDGYEFAELRGYVEGDDPRRIDWAATARAGDLQTRVLIEDEALVFAGILDESASLSLGRKRPLQEAAREALGAWYALAVAGDRVLRVFATTVRTPRGARGPSAARSCLAMSVEETFGVAPAMALARATLPRGSALLVVSDFFDSLPDEGVLRELAERNDCTVLVARDPWQDDLPLRGFVSLQDAESGAIERLYIGRRERERYVTASRAREAALLERFRRAGWRSGPLHERDGTASLYAAFGIELPGAA